MIDPSDDATLPAPETGPVRDAALPVVDRAHYEVISEHARGGLGRILRARDRRTGRLVAIKEMLHGDPDAAARFFREALVTANLQHPAIVPVYELGRWPDGEPFYAMKLVAGRSLDAVIGDAKTLDDRLALVPRLLDVADAVAYAHGEGVIHRDLKPGNVLVGAYGETVVIDWGLAKRTDADEPGTAGAISGSPLDSGDRTVAGAVLGTPAFMAPEQARGEEVDARADVYALGAMLYQLLSGRLPYQEARRADEVLARVRVGPPRPLRELEPGVPADLLAVVAKAMAHARADRYPSASAFADDLRRFLTGQLVGAHAYSGWQLARRFVRRHRGVLAVAAILTTALAITGVISVLRITAEKREAVRLRALADARNTRLILANARGALERDPTEALAWLQQLPPSAPEWEEARLIASDARERGIARWVLRGHTGNVNDLELTADGRLISAGSDQTLRVWDLATGAVTVIDDPDPVDELALTPDGTQLISIGRWVSDDARGRRLTVRDLAGFTARVVPRDGAARDTDIALFPDGLTIAVIDCDAGLRLVDLATMATQVVRPRTPTVETCASVLAVSTDGRTLAAETHRPELDLFAIGPEGPRRTATLALDDFVRQAAFARDGARILALTYDSLAYWPVTGGAPTHVAEGPVVRGFALPRGGEQIVTAGNDNTVRRRDLDRVEDRVLASHTAEINDLVLTPDHALAASASADGTVGLHAVDGTLSRTLRGHTGGVKTVEISSDGAWLVSASLDGTMRVWSMVGARRAWTPRVGTAVSGFVGEPGGTLVLTTFTGIVERWTVDGQRTELRAAATDATTYHPGAIDVSVDGRVLAVGRADGGVDVWRDGRADPDRLGGAVDVAGVAVSADGAVIAWVAKDGSVSLHDAATRDVAVLTLERWRRRPVAVSPDGAVVVWSDADGALGIHDVARATTRTVPHPGGPGGMLRTLVFAGDDVISADLDGEVVRWDVTRDHPTVLFDVATDADTRVRMALSPDGGTLASTDGSHAIRLTELATGASRTLRGHADEIVDLVFSPDGLTLASGSRDSDARLWDVATGASRVIRHHDDVVAVVFSGDGSKLITTTHHGTISVILDDVPRDEAGLRAFLRDATNLEVTLEE